MKGWLGGVAGVATALSVGSGDPAVAAVGQDRGKAEDAADGASQKAADGPHGTG
ncbi:hypothetical protein SAMN04488094_103145 [Tropicimonas isoalkanivorans]|uniref:Uncharacterized protein n=1 Tax=Tropicimonas isoalkanivorans TaxID=441112 RepID=A0A1I1HGN3_9RHOB|nr:hypothetical protein SAMN04488094_103145 [Tropicimonas isoalkanivorans]